MLGVVLAAGSGSRLGYLGGILPKTMVPVRGKPLVHYALRTLAELGATEVRVALGSGSAMAVRYLREMEPAEVGLRSVRAVSFRTPTRSPVETLVRTLPTHASGTVAVALGDDLTVSRGLATWVPRFERAGASVAQAVVAETDRAAIRRTCEVLVDRSGRILRIHEKPATPRWRSRGCGLYLLRAPSVPELVRRAGGLSEVRSLTDLVATAAEEEEALALPIHGSNINVNTVGDLMHAWDLVPRDRGAPL